MVQWVIAIIIFSASLLISQTPDKQGLQEYLIPDKGDTIRFYIYNPDNISKTKIFLYIQGSGAYPMVYRTDSVECCFNTYPRNIMKQFPVEYAFVYIAKMGLPYYTNMDHFEPGRKFIARNNVSDRAEVANKVVNYLTANFYPNATTVAVLGHSEGTDVAAKLAAINKKITHLCFAAGNGTPQIFNDILFIRRKMVQGKISAEEAQSELEILYRGMDSVFQDPNSVEKYFNGDTYKWHSAINQPAIDNLLALDIPIFLAIGSHDDKVPVETSDYIKAEFIRRRKSNLKYKVYLNCDHGFKEILPNNEKKDHFPELFDDFLNFIEQTRMKQK